MLKGEAISYTNTATAYYKILQVIWGGELCVVAEQCENKKITLLFLGVVLVATVLAAISQNYFVVKIYETMDEQRRTLVENNMLLLMETTDRMYQLIERPIEEKSQSIVTVLKLFMSIMNGTTATAIPIKNPLRKLIY